MKGAGTLMAIILISVCGWVAVVALVIKPPFWLGSILSIIGGLAIGTVVAYLIRRWWFKGRLSEIRVRQVHKRPKYELGTRLMKSGGNHHYAQAGEDLKKGTIVEADLAGRIAPPLEPDTIEVTAELIYGNVKAAKEVDPQGMNVLGWPEVNVKKGRYCWLKEPPLGSEFKKGNGS
ncbi:hypothetical protein ES703_56375 [subsurface metagenome]